MSFRPLHDRILVKPEKVDTKTKGGIIIPETAQEKPQQGKVVAAGPGKRGADGKLIPIDVKVGNKVLYGKWSGTEVKVDGEEMVILSESDVMGVLV
ncbi:MAG: co-chaperone GroES [Reyranellaceae bacterium]